MTFQALSVAQALLLAALVAGAVVALYFLKLRHRRVLIASSLLWKRVLDERQAHSLIERLRWWLSLLLALTIALLIGMSLPRPVVPAITGATAKTVIVMDTSPTMAARSSNGRTRWQNAVETVKRMLDEGGAGSEFRVTDTSQRIAVPYTTDRASVAAAIDRMMPLALQPKFPQLDSDDASVYFITDGVAIRNVPSRVERISVFEPTNSVGITAFEIRAMPSAALSYQAYVEIENFGAQTRQAALTIAGPGGQRMTRTMTLAPREPLRETLDLSSLDGGAIRATVQSGDDGYAVDDVAYAYLPVRRKSRALLVTSGNIYLEQLLKLDTHVSLTTVSPAAYKESQDIDVYIFDRYAPAKPPTKPALVVGTFDVPWLVPAGGQLRKPSITKWDANHPVMQYVPVHDISIERATKVSTREGVNVLAASGEDPLILVSERPQRWVLLAFDLSGSDFALQVGFPVFVDNVLAWFGRERLAVRAEPGSLEVPIQDANVRALDGSNMQTRPHLDRTVFEAVEPGLYAAERGDRRMHFAVNLANRDLSNVNATTIDRTSTGTAAASGLGQELWFYMLIAAALLIGIEWFTYHRRITV